MGKQDASMIHYKNISCCQRRLIQLTQAEYRLESLKAFHATFKNLVEIWDLNKYTIFNTSGCILYQISYHIPARRLHTLELCALSCSKGNPNFLHLSTCLSCCRSHQCWCWLSLGCEHREVQNLPPKIK